jgi:hypothetical protein
MICPKVFPVKTGDNVRLQNHLEGTLETAKRMINKLLQVDSEYFTKLHYIDPVFAGPARREILV